MAKSSIRAFPPDWPSAENRNWTADAPAAGSVTATLSHVLVADGSVLPAGSRGEKVAPPSIE
jgi:hypothetical protein